MQIGLDAAASEFYDAKSNTYNLSMKAGSDERKMSPEKLVDLYANLSDKYPIVSIEDPFDQDDFGPYAELTKRIGNKTQIVGDDLLVTNPTRV